MANPLEINFKYILPECVDCLPKEALQYLKRAVLRAPAGDISGADLLAYTKSGQGLLYLACADSQIYGSIFFMVGQGDSQRVLDIVLLGGKSINRWKQQLYDFCVNLAKSLGCAAISVTGRNGWGKLFTELQPVGTIYVLKLTR